MTLKIKISQDGNRKIFLQKHFNDSSGHQEIMDMLVELSAAGWTQPNLVETAFFCMLDAWQSEKGIHVRAAVPQIITQDMRESIQAMRESMARLRDYVQNLPATGVNKTAVQAAITSIESTLDIGIVEGAGNYGSSSIISDEEEEEDEW